MDRKSSVMETRCICINRLHSAISLFFLSLIYLVPPKRFPKSNRKKRKIPPGRHILIQNKTISDTPWGLFHFPHFSCFFSIIELEELEVSKIFFMNPKVERTWRLHFSASINISGQWYDSIVTRARTTAFHKRLIWYFGHLINGSIVWTSYTHKCIFSRRIQTTTVIIHSYNKYFVDYLPSYVLRIKRWLWHWNSKSGGWHKHRNIL